MFWRPYRGPSYQATMAVLRSRYTYWLLLAAGVVLGGVFLYQDHYLREAPSRFRRAPCVIEDADVVAHSHGRWGRPTSFAPAITFTYAAADGPHTVTGYRLFEDGMSEGEAEVVADRYEPGQQTYCWYDAENPNTAVLTMEADTRHLGTLVMFALLLGGVGLAGWVVVDFICKPAAAAPPPVPADDGLAAALGAPLPPARTATARGSQ